MVPHFTIIDICTFILRILGVSFHSKDNIKTNIRYTRTRMKSLGLMEEDPWVYTSAVLSAARYPSKHPLVSVHTKLGKLMVLPTTCLQCDAPVEHYCTGCLMVMYCSKQCQFIHWEGGHMAECELLAAIMHGTSGLAPPHPDTSPQVRAAHRARNHAQDRAHTMMERYLAAVGEIEEGRDRRDELQRDKEDGHERSMVLVRELDDKEACLREQRKETARLDSIM
jgi:hypothetical protein